ncbi:MAG: PQQ-binding-like beta-propeller repeat protein [Candidatus Latescibacterota bacterium]
MFRLITICYMFVIKIIMICILLFSNAHSVEADNMNHGNGVAKIHSYVTPEVYGTAMSRDEKTFYFAVENGQIIALDSKSDTLWIYQMQGHLRYSPTVGYNGDIYFAGNSMGNEKSTKLIALKPDGVRRWEYDLGSGSIGPIATTPEGMLYVATEDSLIHGIDSDSNELWTCQLRGRYYREIVVGTDGTIYATSGSTDDPVIYAIDKNGKKIWECDLPGAISGSGYLVWGDNVLYYFDFYGVYVGGNNIGVSDGLYAVNLDGTLRWHRMQPVISTQLAVAKDTIYAMGEYATLFALSSDGILKWERQLSETNWHRSSITPIIGINKIIYAADFTSGDFIHAVTSGGDTLWTKETGFRSFILDSHGILHWFCGSSYNSTQTTSFGLDAEAPWPCEGGNSQRTYCVMTPKVVSVADKTGPVDFALLKNYPNPFNPSTTIEFSLPSSCKVSLVIYNIMGRKVRELVSGQVLDGTGSVLWDGRDDFGKAVSSGVYFSKLQMGKQVAVGRMLLLK